MSSLMGSRLRPRSLPRVASGRPGSASRYRLASADSALALALFGAGEHAWAQDPVFRFIEIGPGLHASVTGEGFDPSAYANAVVIEGDDGLLLVDTRHGPSAGRDLAEAIRARTDTPVRWIVNTHWHGDHVWGNESILEAWPDVTILGHPATRDRIVASGSSRPWIRSGSSPPTGDSGPMPPS